MIGVNRRVFEQGVHQGQDLFDQRTSLIQYAPLFNAFADVQGAINEVAANGTVVVFGGTYSAAFDVNKAIGSPTKTK